MVKGPGYDYDKGNIFLVFLRHKYFVTFNLTIHHRESTYYLEHEDVLRGFGSLDLETVTRYRSMINGEAMINSTTMSCEFNVK